METKLNVWLEMEHAAAEERKQKERKRLIVGMILLIPGSILLLALIGWLSAGEFSAAISNIKYGVIFAVCCEVILLPFTFCRNSAKRYMKLLKKEITKQLPTSGKQEEFAAQMLNEEGADTVRNIRCRRDYGREDWISVTRDFALMRYSTENCAIARLNEIQRIELDTQTYMVTVHQKNKKSFINTYVFPIHFFYRSIGEGNKKEPDKMFVFEKKDDRDKVLKAIKELCDI